MPISAMTAMALAQTAGGLMQKGQSALARRRAKREFQPYPIPSSAKAMMDKATSLATQRGLPGEDIYRSQAQSSVARGVESAERTAEAPSDVLAVLSRLYPKYMDFEQNLAVQGAQAYERRQGQLMTALDKFGQYETQQWQYNELYPYMQAMGEAGQIDQAGNLNVQSGVTSALDIMGSQADIEQQNEMFDRWKQAMFDYAKMSNPAESATTAQPNSFSGAYEPSPPSTSYKSWTPYG